MQVHKNRNGLSACTMPHFIGAPFTSRIDVDKFSISQVSFGEENHGEPSNDCPTITV